MHIHEAHAAHWPILQLKSKGCTLFAAAVGIIRSAAWGARTQHAIGRHVGSVPVPVKKRTGIRLPLIVTRAVAQEDEIRVHYSTKVMCGFCV